MLTVDADLASSASFSFPDAELDIGGVLKIWMVLLSEQQARYDPVSHSKDKCLIKAVSLPRRTSLIFSPDCVLKSLIRVPFSEVVASKLPSRFNVRQVIAPLCAEITKGRSLSITRPSLNLVK